MLAPPADTLSALGSVCRPGLGPGRNWSVVTMVALGAAAVVSANAVRFSDARTFKLGVSEGE